MHQLGFLECHQVELDHGRIPCMRYLLNGRNEVAYYCVQLQWISAVELFNEIQMSSHACCLQF